MANIPDTNNTNQYVAIRPRLFSPTADPASQAAQTNDGNPTMLTPPMAFDKEATPTSQDLHSAQQREHELLARLETYKTRLAHAESTLDTSQQSTNTTRTRSASNASNTTLDAPSASATIAALRQQLFIAEQTTLQLRHQAGQHIHDLESLVRTSWDRTTLLEGNLNYLATELDKANAHNTTLNDAVRGLRKHAETKEAAHRAALKAAQVSARNKPIPTATAASAAAVTFSGPPLPASQHDPRTRTLLEHNRHSILVLRAEVRSLKASKKQLQSRLLELRSGSAVAGGKDWEALVQRYGDVIPREVLGEREREIAVLGVLIEREREGRAQAESQKCEKCKPVVVDDDDDEGDAK